MPRWRKAGNDGIKAPALSDLTPSIRIIWSGHHGLLVPEQSNKVDSNAVALYLITKEFSVVKVGYLNKDLAKKTSQKIVNLIANEDLVIPVLAIVKKNKDESGALGVVAYAMTDSLRFL